MNTNNRKIASRSTSAGLVLLLVLVGLSPRAEAGFWVKQDWSRVQAVTPGTPTTVRLYKDKAPRGKRKITGRFHSATAESVILLLPDGQTRSLKKQAVLKVLVYRPREKRYQGWITLAVGTALGLPVLLHPDFTALGRAVVGTAYIIGPTAIAFLVAPRMGDIYFVPPDRRNDPTKKPSQHGWITPADMRKAGSRLVDEASPGRLWLQAREARIRDGMLLDSSTPTGIDSVRLRGLDSLDALVEGGRENLGLADLPAGHSLSTGAF